MVKKIPFGVRLISVLFFIIAIFLALFAWLFSLMGAEQFGVLGDFLLKFSRLSLFFVSFPIAIFFFFIAKGLFKAQKWARITAILISILIFFNGLVNLIFMGEFLALNDVVVSSLLGSYFLFNKKVKKFFN